ncbi:GntR family transcriptional regulator [Kaistia sp. 32K]|uniref:GntR family transcriptional regulator n=1 Tax=Kaistia sp. 32K TaxID=2795690 RepID=UPI001AED1515|nr:GntR family transcriptional regulator [Kaistia sp. 32K]
MDTAPHFSVSDINQSMPKTAQVYDLVRGAIVSLAMPPGMVINEKKICEELQISRTPLREAILQLHAENLVEVRPNAGTFVAPIDLRYVLEGQLVRDALEMKVVRFAARRADKAFLARLDLNMHQQRTWAAERDYDQFYAQDEAMHQLICEHGASPRIWRLVTGAKAQLDRVRRLQMPEPNHLTIVLAEHEGIVGAIRAGDENAAAQAMKVHLDRAFLTIRHLMAERSELFAPQAAPLLDEFERFTL